LDEYAQKDPRFRVFHKKNGGVSSARNLGLEKAQGQWVWFVDSDDMIHPESLGWLSTHISAHPNVKTFSITNQCEEDNFKDGAWQPLLPCKVWEECTYTAHGFRFHRRGVATTLLKRVAIGPIRFKPFEIGEDVLFHMEIFWTWPRGLYAATPLYYYRAREGSAITSKPTIKKVSNLLTTEYEMLTLFKEHKTQWSIEKVRKYAQWNETFIWITCRAMFVRLKRSEMKQLLPLWCQVQTLQHELFGATRLRKVALKLIKWTQSPFLCRWLIFPFRVWERLRRAQHVIFR
jgi:glycosyltransferase involved in cell wall biosynthesis